MGEGMSLLSTTDFAEEMGGSNIRYEEKLDISNQAVCGDIQ